MKKNKIKLETFLRPGKKILDKENRENFSNDYFDYSKIWEVGFPVYEWSDDFKYLFQNLEDVYYQYLFEDESSLESNGVIDLNSLKNKKTTARENFNKRIVSNNKTYSQLANCFFPEMFDTEVSGVKFTPLKAFNDPKQLKLALYLAHRWDECPTVKDLRPALRLSGGVQAVTNFKPTAAKCIYDYYGEGLKVFDYSAGFGGRLVGFLASTASEYVGVDVNSVNFPKYKKIINSYAFNCEQLVEENDLEVHCGFKSNNLFSNQKLIKLYNCGSEDFCPPEYKNYFDLSFSSPPYFSKEIYSDDPRQSSNKFGNYSDWLNLFWKITLENQFYMLKNGGHLVINISDIKIGNIRYNLVHDTEKLLEKIGFEKQEYFLYPHSRKPFDSKKTEINKDLVKKDLGYKTEPILSWMKR